MPQFCNTRPADAIPPLKITPLLYTAVLEANNKLCKASMIKGGAYPRPRTVARVVTTLQLFAAETCNKFLKIEHHDSIVYSKHELILTFLAGASSDFAAGNTTQERLDLPASFCSRYFFCHTLPCNREFCLTLILLFHLPIFSEIPE